VTEDAVNFVDKLNNEYKKSRKSKSKQFERLNKLPIRIYGSGDFVPNHLEFLKNLTFPFFIISKNLTTQSMLPFVKNLLAIKKMTSLLLSFDSTNIVNYKNTEKFLKQDRIKFCYTGISDEFLELKEKGFYFDVFFNIDKKKKERIKASQFKESCPVDAGKLALQKACSFCNKCWRSSIIKVRGWNS
jgi:hypothetical protein